MVQAQPVLILLTSYNAKYSSTDSVEATVTVLYSVGVDDTVDVDVLWLADEPWWADELWRTLIHVQYRKQHIHAS